jgi:hypothetical protein
MPERCIDCIPNKTKLYFDLERARQQAKIKAIEEQQTYAIYRQGESVAITTAAGATACGYAIIEMVSFNL